MSVPPSDPSTRILLVEDDAALGGAVVSLLAAAGHHVRWAQNLADASLAAATAEFGLIVLDVSLPDGDGLSLCTTLRQQGSDVVVVVLTAQADEAAAIRALDGGADDFVAKPFRGGELVARLRAHMRRRPASDQELRAGPIRVNLASRTAWLADHALLLRPKEFELLAALVAQAGSAIRRESLIDEVWDAAWAASTKTLDVHVAALRRKLADAGDRWERIETVRGFGYRLDTT